MGLRTYTASITTASLSAAKSLIVIDAPATHALIITGVTAGAPANDTNQQLEFSVDSIASLGSIAGTAITPGQHSPGDPASSVSCTGDIAAGSEPTYSGNPSNHESASSIGGYRWEPGLDGPQVPPSEAIGLQILGSVSATTITARITFVEVG